MKLILSPCSTRVMRRTLIRRAQSLPAETYGSLSGIRGYPMHEPLTRSWIACHRVLIIGQLRLVTPLGSRRSTPRHAELRQHTRLADAERRLLDQKVAIGLTNAPVPPLILTGASVSKNVYLCCRNDSRATSSRLHWSARGIPIATIARTWIGKSTPLTADGIARRAPHR